MAKAIKRHSVTILRPSLTLGSRGQVDGSPTIIASDVPCAIEPLAGRELELARHQVADATQRVTFFDDPSWCLSTRDYLEFGSRRFNIGHISRRDEVELEAVLLCAEDAE